MATLFVYVDESGQETAGMIFVVSVLIASNEKDELGRRLEEMEVVSKKRNFKWRIADYRYRRDYIERLIRLPDLGHKIFVEVFTESKAYMALTATGVADAIRQSSGTRAVVYVDGLRKTEVTKFKAQLKPSVNMPVKVSGVRKDENNVFIRLVDAICGLVRDANEGEEWSCEAVRRLKRKAILTEL